MQGNIIRGNLVAGNPPVQMSVDHTANGGSDIRNLATAGANAFLGNICLTSLNAPCSPVGPSLTASPNPIAVTANAPASTTISWNAPDVQAVEIHIGSPAGPLFVTGGNRGSAQTGAWVADGMTFYLQDVTGGNPLTSDYTLATLVVHLQAKGANGAMLLHLPGGPPWWAAGAATLLLGFSLFRRRPQRRGLRIALGGAALFATMLSGLQQTKGQSQPSPQQTAATLDRMIAAHKSQQELAQYVFDTHGCKDCHTVGQNGKLGFTSRGRQAAGDFQGCIRLLTDMNLIAQTPESRRSSQQRQKAARFQEIGCTLCHKVDPGKLGLTEVGAKLTHMHLGCVDVEKLVAGGPSRQH